MGCTCQPLHSPHTRCVSLTQDASSIWLRLATTAPPKSGTTFRKAAPKPLRDTYLTSPSPTANHATGHSHYLRGWDSQDHRLDNEVSNDGVMLWSVQLGRDEPIYPIDASGGVSTSSTRIEVPPEICQKILCMVLCLLGPATNEFSWAVPGARTRIQSEFPNSNT